MSEIIVFCVLIPLLAIVFSALGVVGTWYLMKKYMEKEFHAMFEQEAKQFADEIFNDASGMLEDKIHDSDLVDSLIEKLFVSLRATFAQQKGLSTRQQQGASKKIVNYFLKQSPVADFILTESGSKEYFEKNPSLLIWGMQTFPAIFNLGGGQTSEQLPSDFPNITPSQPPPPPPIP